jgi:hypothetical protein
VVIITMPGSHLIAKVIDETSIPNKLSSAAMVHPNDDAPVAMFSIRGKSSQFAEAAQDAESRIRDFFMDADYPKALFSHFSGNFKQPTSAWLKKAEQLKNLVLDNRFNLTIQLTASSEMDFMMTAFIAKGANGQPLSLLNSNWIEYGITHEAFTRLIIEQTGFAFDQFLNAENDTKGNEGKAFANDLSSIYENASAAISPNYITFSGMKVLVEF